MEVKIYYEWGPLISEYVDTGIWGIYNGNKYPIYEQTHVLWGSEGVVDIGNINLPNIRCFDGIEIGLNALVSNIRMKAFECKYAFDFIKKDWKKILEMYCFTDFKEVFYCKNYIRLLMAAKEGNMK